MIAYAQTSVIPNPISGVPAVFDTLCLFTAWFIYVVILLSVIMVVVAAFNYLTSGGESEKLTKARHYLTYSAVGIVVVLCAVMFPVIVGTAVGYKSSSGQGLTPMCAILGGTGGNGETTANQTITLPK